MLTRFVRIQLIIFAIASVAGMLVMVLDYMRLPTLLGIGRMTVTLELPRSGGLYRFGNVTYRGTQIGTVTAVVPTAQGARATLSLATAPRIPANLQAQVRSVSAVGEQYVDLLPNTDSGPFLHDGSVIPVGAATVPQSVGPMLDQLSTLLASIPKDSLGRLLDETSQGLGGANYDLGSLVDSSHRIALGLNSVAGQTHQLVRDTAPLLDTQAQTTDAIRLWARSLAGVTSQVRVDDAHLRALLRKGPGAAQEVTRLLNQVKPTLPVLLANLTTVGQVGVTYHPSLEQVLVLLPPLTAMFIASAPFNNHTGIAIGDFRLTVADPSPCTVGFLPPNMWRAPGDLTTIDTPDGLYCKLPQDSPVAVRGARNYPCMGVPGKRAPTVQECNSDRPFEPLAARGHILGPSPVDPNLLSQGVPPDYRVTLPDHLYGPVEGTPPPPGVPPPPGPPPPGPPPPGPPPPGGAAPATPNGFDPKKRPQLPPLAVARYDPATGKYVTSDGQAYEQRDLTAKGRAHTWNELVLPTG